MSLHDYRSMTWPQIDRMDRDATHVILTMGAIEQHGYHMFVDTDAQVSVELARQVGFHFDDREWLLLPPLYYGYAKASEVFPGTLSLEGQTLAYIVRDILNGVLRQGFRRIVVLNSNFENVEFIGNSASEVLERYPEARLAIVQWWEFISEEVIQSIFGVDWHGWGNEHAGIMETSLMLHCNSERVRLNDARASGPEEAVNKFRFRLLPYDRRHFSEHGATLRAEACSKERGAQLLAEFLSGFTELIQEAFD